MGVNGFHSKMQLDVSDELVEEIVVSEHAIDVAAHGRDSTTLFFLIPMNVPSVSAYSVVADTDFFGGCVSELRWFPARRRSDTAAWEALLKPMREVFGLRTVSRNCSLLPGSRWSVLLFSDVMQGAMTQRARVFVDDKQLVSMPLTKRTTGMPRAKCVDYHALAKHVQNVFRFLRFFSINVLVHTSTWARINAHHSIVPDVSCVCIFCFAGVDVSPTLPSSLLSNTIEFCRANLPIR